MIDQEVIENGSVRQIEKRARQKAMGQAQRAQRQVREARRDMKRIQEQIVRVHDGSDDDLTAQLLYSTSFFNPRSMSGRDHYAILINKSDLTGALSPEELETRIVEYRY